MIFLPAAPLALEELDHVVHDGGRGIAGRSRCISSTLLLLRVAHP